MTTSRHDSFLNLWLKTENQESTRVHTSHKARPDCVKDGAEGGSAEQQQCCAVSSEKFGISIHRTRGWTHSVLQHSTSCLPASCWWPCPPCWERRSSSVLPETESPESSCTCRSERKMRMVEYGKWGKWKIGRHRCMDGGGGVSDKTIDEKQKQNSLGKKLQFPSAEANYVSVHMSHASVRSSANTHQELHPHTRHLPTNMLALHLDMCRKHDRVRGGYRGVSHLQDSFSNNSRKESGTKRELDVKYDDQQRETWAWRPTCPDGLYSSIQLEVSEWLGKTQ